MISDYTYSEVNQDTIPLAPAESMQFGRTLPRLLSKLHRANNRFGPVYMSKIDLADGFYRVELKPEDTMQLGVLFPPRPGEAPLIGIPLTNPMGWKSSPPNFCAFTETIADLANATLPTGLAAAQRTPHRLDIPSEATPDASPAPAAFTTTTPQEAPAATQSTTPSNKPVHYWDVYLDDFCGLVQGNQWTRRAIKRVLFPSLDKVFRPLDASDTPFRQEPASLKKMLQGDATWTTKKVILGWLIDSINKTISLPPHRVARLQEILLSIAPTQRHVPIQQWHQVLGELQSMALAIPGSIGLFSILQEAFRHPDPGRQRLRLTKRVHSFLWEFQWLANDLSNRPTAIAELVPNPFPATMGACDASGAGMGGIHFVPLPDGQIQPILWRHAFPKWVSSQLVIFDNPNGTINNSDLELAGSIAHNDILAQAACVQYRTTHNCYDSPQLFGYLQGTLVVTPIRVLLLGLHSKLCRRLRAAPWTYIFLLFPACNPQPALWITVAITN
eukprot:jgi/Psemu1/31438/gm1.31438_g